MAELTLRLGRSEDAFLIATLAKRVVRRWIIPDQPPAAALALLDALRTPVIRRKIDEGQRFHLAFVDGVLAGVAAVRNDRHIFQFFVSTRYQGLGIARKLWNRLRLDCMRRAGTKVFTLNAAPGAISVYRHLGFAFDKRANRPPMKVVSVPMVHRVASMRRPSRT